MGGFDLDNVNAGLPDRIRVTDDACLVHENDPTRWDRTKVIDPPQGSFNAQSTIFSLLEPLKVLGRLISLPPSLDKWVTGRDVVAEMYAHERGDGGRATPGTPDDSLDWVSRYRVGGSFKPQREKVQGRRAAKEIQTLAEWREELRLMSIVPGTSVPAPAPAPLPAPTPAPAPVPAPAPAPASDNAGDQDGASNGVLASVPAFAPECGLVEKRKTEDADANNTGTEGVDIGAGPDAKEAASGEGCGDAHAAMHRVLPHLTTEQRRVALMMIHDRRDLLRNADSRGPSAPKDVVVVLPGHGPAAVGKRW
jgi:hypothetical protein